MQPECACGQTIIGAHSMTCNSCDALLCLTCATKSDNYQLCTICYDINFSQKGFSRTTSSPIKICHTCKETCVTKTCYTCMHEFCSNCRNAVNHKCNKCQFCQKRQWKNKCCSARYCKNCYNLHRITNCQITMSYKCPNCKTKVLQFGALNFACPIEGCDNIFGCHYCCSLKYGGVCCYDHSSKDSRCIGCHKRYVLQFARKLYIKRQGSIRKSRIYCGPCFDRIKTFIECIMIHFKRVKGRNCLEKNIIEKLLLLATNVVSKQ